MITESPFVELHPLSYSSYQDEKDHPQEMNTDYIAYRVGHKWCLLSKRGGRITPPVYEWIYSLDSDRFDVVLDKGVRTIIDGTGKEVTSDAR